MRWPRLRRWLGWMLGPDRDPEPTGCLACNRDAVAEYLRERGMDPALLVPCPPTRHAWGNITLACADCGAVFMLLEEP